MSKTTSSAPATAAAPAAPASATPATNAATPPAAPATNAAGEGGGGSGGAAAPAAPATAVAPATNTGANTELATLIASTVTTAVNAAVDPLKKEIEGLKTANADLQNKVSQGVTSANLGGGQAATDVQKPAHEGEAKPVNFEGKSPLQLIAMGRERMMNAKKESKP